ncbi:class I adenylate-forming enzyme family protein [Hyphococcus sp.]|uniref:class I adenylate-forming enzyme family protein n=1 Tax=Hyphococcus sp. TaxID=2038636 RepID=UPI003CCC2EEE
MLRDNLRRCAEHYPDKIAFHQGERTITWSEIYRRSLALAGALQARGVQPGDRVAILAKECIEIYEHFFACMIIGAIRVGVNWRYSSREMLHVLKNSSVTVCVVQDKCWPLIESHNDELKALSIDIIGLGVDHAFDGDYELLLEKAPELVATDFDEAAPLLHTYTSGATAHPKAVILSHKAILTEITYAPHYYGISANDRYYMPAQSAWVAVVGGLFGLASGSGTIIPTDVFDVQSCVDDINKHKATVALLVPAMIPAVLDHLKEYDLALPSLETIAYGSAPAAPALIRRTVDMLGVKLVQLYGMTECVAWACFLQPDDHRRALAGEDNILRASGRFAAFIDHKICNDDGEEVPAGEAGVIYLKGDTIMSGYLNQPEETADVLSSNGWLKTNDIGRVDENGFVYLLDRRNFLINTGGVNVFPAQVEAVLAENEIVSESSVVGVPHPRWGEAVVAGVVLNKGVQLDEEECIAKLNAHCFENLSKQECPKHFTFMNELPRTITGKLQKRDLKLYISENVKLPWNE